MRAGRGRPRYDDILTPREWQVLALIREGLTNDQIAQRLAISSNTAKFHVSEVLTKLGVATREEAAQHPALPRKLVLTPVLLLRRHLGLPTAFSIRAICASALGVAAVLVMVGLLISNPGRASRSNDAEMRTPETGSAVAERSENVASRELDPANCASGPDGMNPRAASGLILPASQNFASVDDAQRWLCFAIGYPRGLGSWRLAGIVAQRSHDLGMGGFRAADLTYINASLDARLTLDVVLGGVPDVSQAAVVKSSLTVQGEEASWQQGGPEPGFVTVSWQKDGVGFIASTILEGSWDKKMLLLLLESIR